MITCWLMRGPTICGRYESAEDKQTSKHFGLKLSTSAISTRGAHSGDSVVRKMRGLSLEAHPQRFGDEWTDMPSTRKPLRSTNQNAGPSALLAHDRWCFSRSVSALSVRSSFCRARLRIPASLSPSKILGGSDLTASAAACSNLIQILHGIAFTSFEAYTFYFLSGFARLALASSSALSHMFVRTDGRIGVGWNQSNSSPPGSKPCSRRASVKYATARKEQFHELSPN